MSSSTDPSRHPVLNAPVKCWRAFKRLTQLSFPRSYPIVQFPNAPLILAFASGLLARHSRAREHAYAQAVSYLTLAICGAPRQRASPSLTGTTSRPASESCSAAVRAPPTP